MKIKRTTIAVLTTYFVIFGLVYAWYGHNKSSVQVSVLAEEMNTVNIENDILTEPATQMPKYLVIPSLSIILAIEEGNYEETTQSWNVSENNAHFATITSLPNTTEGNTLIYGHNTDNVLGRTKNIKIGDIALVYLDDGRIFEYELVSYKDVKPNDTEVFAYNGDPVLTIVTCTGIADQKRRLMTFNLINNN